MADGKWFVRGVPETVVKQVTDTAKARGQTVGRLVTDLLQIGLQHLDAQPGSFAQPAPLSDEVRAEITALARRVAALEAAGLGVGSIGRPTEEAPDDDARAPRRRVAERTMTEAMDAPAGPKARKPIAGRTEVERAEWKAFASEVTQGPLFEGRTKAAVAEEIASKTGLSKNTVTNVLAGCIPSSADTRGKIRAAVAELSAALV